MSEENDTEGQSATEALANLQDTLREAGATMTVRIGDAVIGKVDGTTATGDVAALLPPDAAAPTEPAAEKAASPETKSSSPTTALPGRTKRRMYAPADDEELPTVDAAPFLAALKFAFTACAKEDDQPALAFVAFAVEHRLERIVFAARDGRRWHAAYVPAPEKLHQYPVALARESIAGAIKDLAHCVKRDGNAKVVFDFVRPLHWYVRYGAPTPLTIQLVDLMPGKAPEGWELPSIGRDLVSLFGVTSAPVALDFEATHEAKARTWVGGGALVRRDELDDHGRRHVTLVDSGGEELARAVLVQLGRTDGLPAERQTEIAGTLSPAKRKKAPVYESGIAAGPAVVADKDGHWRVERKNANTGLWDTIISGTEDEMSKYYDSGSDLACSERLMRPDGTTVHLREGKPGPAKAREKRTRALKPLAKTKPAAKPKASSPKAAKPATPKRAPKKSSKPRR